MIKKLLMAVVLLGVTACATVPATQAPAPLAQTTLDEQALIVALNSYEVVLTTVDALIAAKAIIPGTPKAMRVKQFLIDARTGIVAARAAQRAGSAKDYATALRQTGIAYDNIRLLVKGH